MNDTSQYETCACVIKIRYILRVLFFLICDAKFGKKKVTTSLAGGLEAEVQNPVRLYSMFILSEPEKVGSGSATSL